MNRLTIRQFNGHFHYKSKMKWNGKQKTVWIPIGIKAKRYSLLFTKR